MKHKIVRYYDPLVGTWYRVSRKVLFLWWKSPLVFTSEADARTSCFWDNEEFFSSPSRVIVDL